MLLTNKHDLPSTLYDALSNDSYDVAANSNVLSVTRMIDSPKVAQLTKRHWNQLEDDISNRIWLLLGSAVHTILERVTEKGRMLEKRMYIDTNTWEIIDKEHLDKETIYIAGKPDVYEKEEKAIRDYKITCLPLDAEALTKEGWKTYNQLKIGEDILAYNPDTDYTTWTPLLQINYSPKAEVMRLKSKSFDIECTPNHKWFVQSKSKWKKKVYKKIKLIETKDFKSGHTNIISAAKCKDKNNHLKITPTEASLIGWIITDGGINWNRLSDAYISQSKEPFRTKIRTQFAQYIRKEDIRTKGWKNPISIFKIKLDKIRNILKKGKIKKKSDLLNFVTNISPIARSSMLKSMIEAEGYTKKTLQNSRPAQWSQKPGIVFDCFQILSTLEGKRLYLTFDNNGCNYTGYKNTRYTSVYKRQTGKSIFDGNRTRQCAVWCPTTKYGSFVTRYKKQVTITGNSAWSVVYGKKDWITQLNCYAYFFRKLGYEVNELTIIAILKDWNKKDALKSKDYPNIPVAVINIPLWSLEKQQEYIQERVRIHSEYNDLVDDDIPECTEAERWHKKGVFAIYKNQNKTALKLFPTSREAELFKVNIEIRDTKNSYSVVERDGMDNRCNGYCSVNSYCHYYKKTYGTK